MALSDRQRKLTDVQRVPFWWHTIDLGDGIVTPGQTSMHEQELRVAGIPRSLQGRTVLDVGCWDGFFSFWCEQRGATVTPIDSFQHTDFIKSKYGVQLKGGEGFRVAARCLGSALKLRKREITQLKGSFDIVLFLGVLYHQRNPLLALEHLSRLTRECAVVETHYLKGENCPILQFYPGSSLNSDPTNCWGPSLSCVELMLRDVGFQSVRLAETWQFDDDRALFVARK